MLIQNISLNPKNPLKLLLYSIMNLKHKMLALGVGKTNKIRTVGSRVDVCLSLLQEASRLRDIRRREVAGGVGCKLKLLFCLDFGRQWKLLGGGSGVCVEGSHRRRNSSDGPCNN
jgi:hypothetical protein